jgi:hypothetical protein
LGRRNVTLSRKYKDKFKKYLFKLGVDINSTNLTGDLKYSGDVEFRLNPQKVVKKLNSLI